MFLVDIFEIATYAHIYIDHLTGPHMIAVASKAITRTGSTTMPPPPSLGDLSRNSLNNRDDQALGAQFIDKDLHSNPGHCLHERRPKVLALPVGRGNASQARCPPPPPRQQRTPIQDNSLIDNKQLEERAIRNIGSQMRIPNGNTKFKRKHNKRPIGQLDIGMICSQFDQI